MDQVLAEIDPVVAPAIAHQGTQRFGTALRRRRIDGRDDAARAGLGDTELQFADADAPPAVFCIGGAALNHQVGAKTQHGHRLRQTCIEIIQRCLRDQQKRKTIGESDLVGGRGVIRVYGAPRVIWKDHQAAVNRQELAEPGIRVATHRYRVYLVPPHHHRQTRTLRPAHHQIGHARGLQQQPAVVIHTGIDQCHSRLLPLRHELSLRIDHHPVTIETQTTPVHFQRIEPPAPQRFHRVAVKRLQDQFRHRRDLNFPIQRP